MPLAVSLTNLMAAPPGVAHEGLVSEARRQDGILRLGGTARADAFGDKQECLGALVTYSPFNQLAPCGHALLPRSRPAMRPRITPR